MKIRRPLTVVRVEPAWPVTWYAGTDSAGGPVVTHIAALAWCFYVIEDARSAVDALRIEYGGVWGIRSVEP